MGVRHRKAQGRWSFGQCETMLADEHVFEKFVKTMHAGLVKATFATGTCGKQHSLQWVALLCVHLVPSQMHFGRTVSSMRRLLAEVPEPEV